MVSVRNGWVSKRATYYLTNGNSVIEKKRHKWYVLVKFIHTTDNYLDRVLHGLECDDGSPVNEIRSATRLAFDNLIEFAIDGEVDFVLLGGDFYDGDLKDYNIATVNVLSDPSLAN